MQNEKGFSVVNAGNPFSYNQNRYTKTANQLVG